MTSEMRSVCDQKINATATNHSDTEQVQKQGKANMQLINS